MKHSSFYYGGKTAAASYSRQCWGPGTCTYNFRKSRRSGGRKKSCRRTASDSLSSGSGEREKELFGPPLGRPSNLGTAPDPILVLHRKTCMVKYPALDKMEKGALRAGQIVKCSVHNHYYLYGFSSSLRQT